MKGETLPRSGIAREAMLKRVARFNELRGSDGGLPDSRHPSAERQLYNVIGFQPPANSGGAITSPVGDVAARLAAIKISEGFNLGYCRAKPGRGPMMHNHDTNETFIPMTGTWRCSWENEAGAVDYVDLGPARRRVVSARRRPPFRKRDARRSRSGRDPDVRHRR